MIRLFRRNTAPVQTAMLVQMIQKMQEYQREVLIPAMPTAPERSEQVRILKELGRSIGNVHDNPDLMLEKGINIFKSEM